jgi:hypothetical protein
MAGRPVNHDRFAVDQNLFSVGECRAVEKAGIGLPQEMVVARRVVGVPVRVGDAGERKPVLFKKRQNFLPGAAVNRHGSGRAVQQIGQVIPVAELFDLEHVIFLISRF